MRLMNSLQILSLVLLVATSPAASAESLSLDGDAAEQVRRLLDELSGGLIGAAKGEAEARNALLARAIMPRFFSEELNVFTSRANEEGQVRDIKITGFEVQATLWLGLLPVEKVALFFWVGDDEIRLLKFDRDESHQIDFFGAPGAPSWAGETALAFGTLAEKVLKTASQGQCQDIPLVRPSDVMKGKKKAPRATEAIEAQKARSDADCAAFSGMPFNRMTWKLGPASGVVTTRKKAKLGFGLELLAGPERDIRVYRLTRPQGAR